MFGHEVDVSRWYPHELPGFLPVRQKFSREKLADLKGAVLEQLSRPEIAGTLKPGMRIAIGMGSRGIANLQLIAQTVVSFLWEKGCTPFIFPAMGSHGGATAKGQEAILESYGITKEWVGAPVISSMDTVCLGGTALGNRVYADANAHSADGIILINRIKVHTDFKGRIESGIPKMLVIGLGKNEGANAAHAMGVAQFPEVLPMSAKLAMDRANFLFGLGIVENAYDETLHVEALEKKRLLDREPELLTLSKASMGRILPEEFDVLLVEEMGKEISGTGMDTNITGRSLTEVEGFAGPKYQRLGVLDLSPHSDGNATGVGAADVITRRLLERINFGFLYTNALTSSIVKSPKIPMVMPTEQQALMAAAATCTGIDQSKLRAVFIRNTLQLEYLLVSEALAWELSHRTDLEWLPLEGKEGGFDGDGRFRLRPSDFY